MSEMTLTEAQDEFEEISTKLELWIEKTKHLRIAVVFLRDDLSPTCAGYMAFAGRGERLQLMLEHVQKLVNQGDETCR
jgi:hypothetical protein